MNPRILEIPPSIIRQIASKKKPTSIDLGLGEPSLQANQDHLDFAMGYVKKHGMRYTPNAGNPALRTTIAEYYAYPGFERAENVCVTTGSQEAMYVVIKTLLDPQKDELLVVEPAFPAYRKIASLETIAVSAVEMDEISDFAFDARRIIAALNERTRAIILCSPCNPTGRVFTLEQARLLVVELERRNAAGSEPIWIVHDEIYREQTFVEDPAYFARLYPHTVTVNSLSKSNALTGLRLGWMLGPERFIAAAIKCHAWLTSCADTFAQAAALHIFEHSQNPDTGIGEHRGWYARQRESILRALERSGLRFLPIDGSFYACVKLPAGESSFEAAMALADDRGVLAVPGIAFGENFEGWLRLSWVIDPALFEEGLSKIAAFRRP